jgi:uncharacterized protein
MKHTAMMWWLPIAAALTMVSAVAARQSPTLPSPNGRINDLASVLGDATERELDSLLSTLEEETTAEVAVATVPSLDGMTVDEYANRLFNAWGVGQRGKDNGVLVLVAPAVREMRIEVGYGLEGVLPDGLSGQIIRQQFVPAFAKGDYEAGIVAGVTRVAEIVRRNHTLSDSERQALSRGTDGAIVLPSWVAALLFVPFVGSGGYLLGIGLGARVILMLLVGTMISFICLAIANAWSTTALMLQGVVTLALLVVGFIRTRNPKFAARFRDSRAGWIWNDRTASSRRGGFGGGSSRSTGGGSSGGFGGGRSGGGGASGRW